MKMVSLYVDSEVYEDLKKLAESRGESTSAIVREAMLEYNYRQQKKANQVNEPPPASAAKILKEWKSRAELLEDFFDS